FWLNGLKTSASVGTSPSITSLVNLSIGSLDYPGRNFQGQIAEVRIYNRTLSDPEIASRYAASLPSVSVGYPQVWVKTGANNSIAMYYGNANATSMSSGANTFEFFDDFKYTGLSDSNFTARWSLSDAVANISLDGSGTGKLRINGGAIYSNSTVVTNPKNYVFEQKNQWLAPLASSPAGITVSDYQYFL